MCDFNSALPDERDSETKKRRAEREATDVSVKEIVENGTIIMVRETE